MKLKEMIKVMEHFDNGGDIECSKVGEDSWKIANIPCWDWVYYKYRIKKEKRVVIEKWLCQDKLGEYVILESSNVDKYKPHKKIKLMEIYEVEL